MCYSEVSSTVEIQTGMQHNGTDDCFSIQINLLAFCLIVSGKECCTVYVVKLYS